MLTGLELEVACELEAGHAGLAFQLDFVEGEDGIFGGAYEEVFGRYFQLIGRES
jgi:hypothetical protein